MNRQLASLLEHHAPRELLRRFPHSHDADRRDYDSGATLFSEMLKREGE